MCSSGIIIFVVNSLLYDIADRMYTVRVSRSEFRTFVLFWSFTADRIDKSVGN